MNPPTIYWSAELAAEAGGEPIHGLIQGDSYGLFCWDLRAWARLASLPDDTIELGPVPGATFLLPAPQMMRFSDGVMPQWGAWNCTVTAWPEGVEIDTDLTEDVDGLEAYALSLLAAVRAHRRMRGAQ